VLYCAIPVEGAPSGTVVVGVGDAVVEGVAVCAKVAPAANPKIVSMAKAIVVVFLIMFLITSLSVLLGKV